jgi:phospholipid/cholesterol/gamma-HCH transport system permease protein
MVAATDRAESAERGWVEAGRTRNCLQVRVGGDWVIATAPDLDRRLRETARHAPSDARAEIDLSGVDRLDTAGAWLIQRTATELGYAGLEVSLTGADERHSGLLDQVGRIEPTMDVEGRAPGKLEEIAHRAGRATFFFCSAATRLLNFYGMLMVKTARTVVQPRRLRFKSLVYHMEETGLNAMPIVGLLAFLLGVVMAYQGATQLQRFGAEIFTVNLLGISILREIGVLITAIIIAGRSGSAFTAQIGTMKVSQEIDAMETLGLDPIEILVLPRIFALFITLPLLTFYANFIGLVGGAIMANLVLDISFSQFVAQLETAIDLTILLVGLVKAPVFAFVIAMVGCYEGLQVSGSAESVGRQTTQAVVESIFLVIVIDALFSVLFASMGI